MTDLLSADEIDQLLTAINSGADEPEEKRPDGDSRKIKIYDFKRPDKFSRDQLKNISIIHQNFARLAAVTTTAKCRNYLFRSCSCCRSVNL